MNQLVTLLNRLVDRPVIDKTGLTGNYDVQLHFAAESTIQASPGEITEPSIYTALQEQLGLKLEPGKEPVAVLVIDGAHAPGDNQPASASLGLSSDVSRQEKLLIRCGLIPGEPIILASFSGVWRSHQFRRA